MNSGVRDDPKAEAELREVAARRHALAHAEAALDAVLLARDPAAKGQSSWEDSGQYRRRHQACHGRGTPDDPYCR